MWSFGHTDILHEERLAIPLTFILHVFELTSCRKRGIFVCDIALFKGLIGITSFNTFM